MGKTNQTILQRFGRYLLLDHLVDGGMAKICRARFLGEQADKVVAIKMIQPQYSTDDAFKNMFLDEIKVTFGLNHPNICQTYDYGIENEQLFTAMEYVDGKNLKQFLDKLRERNFVFPVEISVHIVSQASQGLHYAHTFTDKLTGKKANIIHRDISPHNVMITYDGAVKIIDFGIAKAETNSDATQAGTIKGKLSYLAPEYLEGLELDPTYDQFALGITLWEMLCSRKLFKAPNDLAVLKQIQACKIPPPSSINPNVSKELDQIVLKALSKDRKLRYENLDQMNRALVKFLYTNYPDFNATDLSYFAKELFKEDIKLDKEKLFEFGKIDIMPYIEDMKNTQGSSPATGEEAPKIKKETVLDFGFEKEAEEESAPKVAKPSATRKTRPTQIKATANQISKTQTIPLAETGLQETKSDATQVGTRSGIIPGGTGITRINIAKKKDTTRYYIVAGVVLALIAGYVHLFKVRPTTEARDPSSIEGTQKVDSSVGMLSVKNKHVGQKIFINGELRDVSVFGDLELPVGHYTMRVETKIGTERKKHIIERFTISTDEPVKITLPDVNSLETIVYGSLHMSRSCIRGNLYFSLWGEQRIERLPIVGPDRDSRGIALPAGTYDMEYERSDEEGIRRPIRITIEEYDLVDLCSQDL